MTAVVVVVVVGSVLAPDLPRAHQGLGQVGPFQIQVFEPDILVMLRERGRRAPYGTQVNDRLGGEKRADM